MPSIVRTLTAGATPIIVEADEPLQKREGHRMARLRVGLTISGAVSLGAYEGGALAAFLLAAQRLEGQLVVDAISGASAGAITGVLATRCLLRGCDPIDAMRQAWVDLPSADHLATHDMSAPLNGNKLLEFAHTILDSSTGALPDGPAGSWCQSEPIHMTMAIVPLGGFGYRISDVARTTTIDAMTFLDWCSPTLDVHSSDDDYQLAAHAAMASGANAAGFAPRLYQHPASELDQMTANGIRNPPGPDGVWYTDGGTVDNEPLGRLLDVVADIDSNDPRVYLIVHPFAENAPGPSRWTDADHQPRWLPTAHRAYSLRSVQSLYDDLQQLMKVNSRLIWIDKVTQSLTDAIDGATAEMDTADAAALTNRLTEALTATIGDLDADRDELNARIGRASAAAPAPTTKDVSTLLSHALHRAAGLSGKRPATVEIVSPALDPSGADSEDLLAGEKLGHFFGFLDVDFRRSDFALGYAHMRTWLATALPTYGFTDTEVTSVLEAVDEGQGRFGWEPIDRGSADFGDLSWPERGKGAEVLVHALHLFEKDLRHWSEDPPTPRQ